MNYFEYFSEIEERFTRRRGSALLLSTLDWALIETWREAGVPLAAVLRGIDDAFDRYEKRSLRAQRAKSRLRKVNGLLWCAQAVMAAAQVMAEAATGAGGLAAPDASRAGQQPGGFEAERVAGFLEANAAAVASAEVPAEARERCAELAGRLRALAAALRAGEAPPLDELDRTLTVLEERLVASITAALPEAELVNLRAQADREMAPLRSKLTALQLRPVREQFLTRRLLAERALPRLSLFYMGVGE